MAYDKEMAHPITSGLGSAAQGSSSRLVKGHASIGLFRLILKEFLAP